MAHLSTPRALGRIRAVVRRRFADADCQRSLTHAVWSTLLSPYQTPHDAYVGAVMLSPRPLHIYGWVNRDYVAA